ncbi:DUF3048 domain-containing protein [Paenibacillus naphthalenovorans]|uniref:DUF3048 domain-containing protein n=1 Tax=Paenibacillus naphthalenovorans TaxID=162209 RepID=UPI00201E3954|nr:DUF3048 domain-containing protein [Paenibacillus naphthalenovorans]
MKPKQCKQKWSRMGRKGGMALLVGWLALTAAGCQTSGNPPAETVKPVVVEPKVPPPKAEPAFQAPLTGLPSDRKIEDRPIMVMINNAPQARPQSGLTQADMLLEVLAEGEITRIVGIFQSSRSKDPVGPVRSIRPYFIEIGKSFGAIQVHAGGSPDGYSKLKKERIHALDEITNAGAAFWRERSRKAPHNLYTDLEKIRETAQERGFTANALAQPAYSFVKKDADAVPAMANDAQDAPKVDITFLMQSYKVTYEFDQTSGLYKRSINGKQHIDLNNEEQLSAANVVVMGTRHRTLDSEGRLDVKLIGTGPALLFERGKVKKVEWKRDKESDPIRFLDLGREAVLQQGQTHIMIVPDTPSFESHVNYGQQP